MVINKRFDGELAMLAVSLNLISKAIQTSMMSSKVDYSLPFIIVL